MKPDFIIAPLKLSIDPSAATEAREADGGGDDGDEFIREQDDRPFALVRSLVREEKLMRLIGSHEQTTTLSFSFFLSLSPFGDDLSTLGDSTRVVDERRFPSATSLPFRRRDIPWCFEYCIFTLRALSPYAFTGVALSETTLKHSQYRGDSSFFFLFLPFLSFLFSAEAIPWRAGSRYIPASATREGACTRPLLRRYGCQR